MKLLTNSHQTHRLWLQMNYLKHTTLSWRCLCIPPSVAASRPMSIWPITFVFGEKKTYILCGYCNADHTVHCRLIDTLHRTMQRNPHRHSAPESCCMQKAKCCFHHFCSHAVFPRTYCTLSSYFPLLLTMFISSLALHFLAPEALFLPTRWYPCLGWSAALSAHHKRVGLIEPGRKGHREKGVSAGWSAGVC